MGAMSAKMINFEGVYVMSPMTQNLWLSSPSMRYGWSIAGDECRTDSLWQGIVSIVPAAYGSLPFSNIAGRKSH